MFAVGEGVRRRNLVDGTGDGIGLLLTDADDDLATNAVLEPIRFTLPLGRPIVTSGIVRHRRHVELDGAVHEVAGVHLVGTPDADRRRLEAWIRLANRPPPAAPGCTLRSLYDTVLRFETKVGARDRTVLRASALGLDVALDAGDADLATNDVFAASVNFDGEPIATGEAVITEIVRYRGLPVRMLLSWARLSPEERRRLSQMAGGSVGAVPMARSLARMG
ncbi:hypothetical protein LBMAG42_35020 [Deltaproteobacteria bacterium]|nr:hypothetical protein LBMAG42_35020 [Deltaproteobacteria bacterium]